jgi:hypothetical protein
MGPCVQDHALTGTVACLPLREFRLPPLKLTHLFFFLLGLELRVYILSHSTSPLFVMGLENYLLQASF